MGDDLTLVAIEPGKRRLHGGQRLRFALRAAELADLAARGRIRFGTPGIEVVDPQRVEDRRLNNVLRGLETAGAAPSVREWLRAAPRSLPQEYLSRLEDQKLLRVRRWRDRGGRTHHDILFVDVDRRRDVLAGLDQGTGGDALAALVDVSGLAPVAYPGLRGRAARRRLAARARTGALVSASADAARAADEVTAAMVGRGIDGISHGLFGELSTIYSEVTTGGHGLGHDIDSGGWSSGDLGGGHHHVGGHHGAGDGAGGW